MRVSNKTRNEIRSACSAAELPIALSDKDLDVHIRELRKAVGASPDSDLQSEAALALVVLRPFKEASQEAAEQQGYDSDQWGGILYGIFLAATLGQSPNINFCAW